MLREKKSLKRSVHDHIDIVPLKKLSEDLQ